LKALLPWTMGFEAVIPQRAWELQVPHVVTEFASQTDYEEHWTRLSNTISIKEDLTAALPTARRGAKLVWRGQKPLFLHNLLLQGCMLEGRTAILYVSGRLGQSPLMGLLAGHMGISLHLEGEYQPAGEYLIGFHNTNQWTWVETAIQEHCLTGAPNVSMHVPANVRS